MVQQPHLAYRSSTQIRFPSSRKQAAQHCEPYKRGTHMADFSQHGSSQTSSSGRLSGPTRTSPPGNSSVGSDSSVSKSRSRRKLVGGGLGGRQLSKKASLEKLQTYGSCIAW